jgi:hypothetical protein
MIKRAPPGSADSSTNETDATSARVERARRGLKKGQIFARGVDYSKHFPELHGERWDQLVALLEEAGIESGQAGLLARTQMAASRLNATRRSADPDEYDTLKTFLKAVRELSRALAAITSHDRLRNPFDDVIRTAFAEAYAVLFKLLGLTVKGPSNESEYLSFLWEALPAGDVMKATLVGIEAVVANMAKTLSEAARIRNAAEYKFVSDVAEAWHQVTHEFPTMSRNYQQSKEKTDPVRAQPLKPPNPTFFQRFIEIAVSSPSIKDETVRGAVEEFKERKRAEKP